MRIAYDHQVFAWQRYGGVSRYFMEIATRLGREHEVAIIAPLYINGFLGSCRNISVLGRPAPEFRKCGRLYRRLNGMLAHGPMRRFAPQLVHETYYSFRSVAPKDAAVVVTVHDMVHERLPGHVHRWDPTAREKAAAVARADHIICVSENTRTDLIEILNVPKQKTSVIYPAGGLTAAVKPGQRDRPYLLYVGSRKPYKNFDGLLRAYASSPLLSREFDLVCFGGGALHLENVVHVDGDDRKLAALYAGAAALVYPSFYEGFGIPPLEAMSLGCPVICSNTSSLPEAVGAAAELFDPADDGALRAAIERVVGSPEHAQALKRAGYERAKLFSWDKCAAQTLAVYQQLA